MKNMFNNEDLQAIQELYDEIKKIAVSNASSTITLQQLQRIWDIGKRNNLTDGCCPSCPTGKILLCSRIYNNYNKQLKEIEHEKEERKQNTTGSCGQLGKKEGRRGKTSKKESTSK